MFLRRLVTFGALKSQVKASAVARHTIRCRVIPLQRHRVLNCCRINLRKALRRMAVLTTLGKVGFRGRFVAGCAVVAEIETRTVARNTVQRSMFTHQGHWMFDGPVHSQTSPTNTFSTLTVEPDEPLTMSVSARPSASSLGSVTRQLPF